MNKSLHIKSLLVFLICSVLFTTSGICTNKVVAEAAPKTVTTQAKPVNTTYTDALTIVNNPTAYLKKTVTIKAKFDKFSTLGLDYKSAFKSSEEYITFLIKREDTSYNIPLSEMKLFLKRKEAEKFIDLKTDDEIEITGNVFSDALGDTWIDVTKLVVTKKAPDKNGDKVNG